MHAALIFAVAGFGPAAALSLAGRFRWAAFVGPVSLCYLAGMAVANLARGFVATQDATTLAEGAVVLGIPLLLFSTDIPRWTRLARPTVVSFILACVSAMVCAAIGAYVFAGNIAEGWKVAAMLVGVYTGGTANLTAIGLALSVPQATFILTNTADIVAGGSYFILLVTILPRIVRKFFPPFPAGAAEPEPLEAIKPLALRGLAPGAVKGMFLAAGISLVAVGLSYALWREISPLTVILTITTLSLAASFHRGLRTLPGPYELGEYLLLVFCAAIGMTADLREVLASGGTMLGFVFAVMYGSILLHFLLAAIFRIDADTVLITSTATIFGPAFIGPVAKSLGNREIVVSGITTAIIGYAAGTYLGLMLAWMIRP